MILTAREYKRCGRLEQNSAAKLQVGRGGPSSFQVHLPVPALENDDARLMVNQSLTTGRPDDLGVLHAVEHGKCSNGRPVPPELVGVNDV